MEPTATPTPPTLRPWRRLAVRLAAGFVLVTLATVGVVGVLVHQRQSREVEDTVGTQLLNIARVSALLIDPAAHAEVARARRADAPAYRRVTQALAAIRDETLLTTPMRTLADYDRATRRARIVVTTADDERPGETFVVGPEAADAVAWTFEDGVARYTGIYRTRGGPRISAFAPVLDARGRTAAVLEVDYPVDFYFDRLRELDTTIALGSLAGVVLALILAVVFARRLTRPIVALTGAAGRVAGGDLSQALAVTSRDEVGQLTRAFNAMVEGLRQREVIRNAFGRYVSPEVARAVLESPGGLALGGRKREITVLMSDLRGYTRFAEHGDPAGVMEVLNDYLGRMADVVIAHGGTINEFIGDAIFAVYGAPVDLSGLRGLGGRWAQRREAAAEPGRDVSLPLVGWVVDGKQVRSESFAGRVQRLGPRFIDAEIQAPLAPLTNVRLRLTWPDLDRVSGDVWGKVTSATAGRVRIHLTSVDPADAAVLEGLGTADAASEAS